MGCAGGNRKFTDYAETETGCQQMEKLMKMDTFKLSLFGVYCDFALKDNKSTEEDITKLYNNLIHENVHSFSDKYVKNNHYDKLFKDENIYEPTTQTYKKDMIYKIGPLLTDDPPEKKAEYLWWCIEYVEKHYRETISKVEIIDLLNFYCQIAAITIPKIAAVEHKEFLDYLTNAQPRIIINAVKNIPELYKPNFLEFFSKGEGKQFFNRTKIRHMIENDINEQKKEQVTEIRCNKEMNKKAQI